MKYRLFFLPLLFLQSSCNLDSLFVDDQVSSGTCYAEPEMLTVVGIIDPKYTHFYRDDQPFGVEHAFVDIRVVANASNNDLLVVDAHFADMPRAQYEHTYPLLGPGYIDLWNVLFPINAIILGDSFSINSADRENVKGVFTIQYQSAASITCDIVLGRKYSLDTDDGTHFDLDDD